MNLEAPNYYGILPANVRYDKNLKPMEKILYTEISALTNQNGYCYATNSYFAELYGNSSETVSRWISNLAKNGYLRIEIDALKGNQRKIFLNVIGGGTDENINSQKNQDLLTKKSRGIDKKDNTLLTKKSRPIDEKVKHNNKYNNTSINNKLNNKTNKEKKVIKKEKSLLNSQTIELLNNLGVDESFAEKIIDYMREIEKPLKTPYKLNRILSEYVRIKASLKWSPEEIFEFQAGKEWADIKLEWIKRIQENNQSNQVAKDNNESKPLDLSKFGFGSSADNDVIDINLVGGY